MKILKKTFWMSHIQITNKHNKDYWSPSQDVKTKRLNIILFLATTINKVYTITLILMILFTRMMTLANILASSF